MERAFGLSEIDDVVAWFSDVFLSDDDTIVLFDGMMGAGKTTFIKHFCEHKKVSDPISSPTYSIVNEYSNGKEIFYHFDFYRINDEEEAWGIGIDEYFDSGNLCLIEWPSKIENIIPSQYVLVSLLIDENGTRIVNFSKHG